MNPFSAAFYRLGRGLAGVGLIDAERADRTVDLAWPRVITGFARLSQQLADLAMIGIVLGPPALAGMAFAFAYWQIGNRLSLGLSGGTLSLVSQRYGARDDVGIEAVIKQSVWIALVLAAPITAVYWAVPVELIGLLGAAPTSIGHGAVYLSVVSLALAFEFQNKLASRILVGVDDALTPMYVRGAGALSNIALNAVFIFGLGLGVLGAALGTVLATVLTTALFVYGFAGRPLPVVGRFPVVITGGGPLLDLGLARQLLVISVPLMGRALGQSLVIFPLLAIVSAFGTGAVAAFEVARRIRSFMNAPGWGFSLASSSLVGQALGSGDERDAGAYGWDILRFATVVYVAVAVLVFAFAPQLAAVFVSDPDVLGQTVTFIRIGALSGIGLGIDGSATGALRGAGDTRWPLYGKFAGLYVVALPLAYLGLVTPIGIVGVYAAVVTETWVPAGVSLYRYSTGRWVAVSRSFRPSVSD